MSLVELALKKIRDSKAPPELEACDASRRSVAETPVAPRVLARSNRRETPPRLDVALHVDLSSLRGHGLLASESQERAVNRKFRRIKLPLVAHAQQVDTDARSFARRLIMVASAFSGEGKTFSAVNLAFALARERDWEVLLVDADVAKPNVTHAFGLDERPGLLDCLADESADAESIIVRTDVGGLSVLPAGHFSEETATELLASARMRDVLLRIAAANPRRIVLFDSPPLLLTTESQVLAGLVGQIVLVIRAGVTQRHAVADAVALLDPTKAIGVILNQSSIADPDTYGAPGAYGYYGAGAAYGTYGAQASIREVVDPDDDSGPP
jgi:exopolysaccharide/PEP-CTERM locus tyrosine autokinase